MQGDNGRLRVVAHEESDRHAARTASGDAPSPGRFLREQRLRRGMSIEQLAAITKIPKRSLEMLEDDLHHGLPGPVFVKGFLRCVARALSLDVQAVMDLLYERERAAITARRGGRPSPPTAPSMPTVDGGSAPKASTRHRAKSGPTASTWVESVRGKMPSPAVFLWVLVAAFVAMVVLAAFNLVGGGAAGPS
jgi:cytoskeletal protein RodZ